MTVSSQTIRRILVALAVAVLVVIGGLSLRSSTVSAQATSTQVTSTQEAVPLNETQALLDYEQNTVDLYKTYGPSVVAVNVEVSGELVNPFNLDDVPEQFRQFFEPFGQLPQTPQQGLQRGSGSGFVVEGGHIVTNYHVVADALEANTADLKADAKVSVTFENDFEKDLPVRVVGVNPSYDLALLELENASDLPSHITPIPFADSDAAQVGQKVVAIGNPFGLQSTVTTGIISGIERDLTSIGQFTIPMIQTDAAINPGNSGGPLLNSRGELVGINTAIIPGIDATGQRSFLGVGFAIPANLLQENLASLEEGGFKDVFSSKPRMGIEVRDVSDYPESVRSSLGMPAEGEMVVAVQEGSPAAKAGLIASSFTVDMDGVSLPAGGDVITAVNGKPVGSAQVLQDVVFSMNAGDTVELTLWRDRQEVQVSVTLEVVPLAQATPQESDN